MQTRRKKRVEGMVPVMEWLDTEGAASYLNISRKTFETIRHNFTIAALGKKNLYKVSDLKKYIESRIVVNAVL